MDNNYENPGVYNEPTPNFVTYVPFGFTPKTYEEKKCVRKSSLIIGLSLIVLLAITLLWSTVYIFVMGKLGFTPLQAANFIKDPAVTQILQIIISLTMFTLPFIVIFKSNNQNISELVPLGKPKGENLLAMYFLGVSICAFANIANSIAGQFFSNFGIDYNVDYGENPKGIFGFILSFIATAIVPGLIEEFACRGLIFGRLRKHGDGFAVLVSSLLFGIMHGNFDQMPFAFIVGLGLGFIVIKTNSLWIAVAVHATNNFISVLFTYILKLSASAQNLIYNIYLMTVLLLGITALFITKNKTDLFKFNKNEDESSTKQKLKWFFLSPTIIIFVVACLLQSLLYFR